jgi:SAM-dependent methyltransferase
LDIAKRYEKKFREHGSVCRGVDWPNEKDMQIRYEEMLMVTDGGSIIDFGCGYGGLLNYMNHNSIDLKYTGIDIVQSYIDFCRLHYKENRKNFHCYDVFREKTRHKADYVIMNGVLTARYGMTKKNMLAYSGKLIKKCFEMCEKGLAVNFSSPYCDRHRDKLFCPGFNEIAALCSKITKKFRMNHDRIPYEQVWFIWK